MVDELENCWSEATAGEFICAGAGDTASLLLRPKLPNWMFNVGMLEPKPLGRITDWSVVKSSAARLGRLKFCGINPPVCCLGSSFGSGVGTAARGLGVTAGEALEESSILSFESGFLEFIGAVSDASGLGLARVSFTPLISAGRLGAFARQTLLPLPPCCLLLNC